MGTAMTTRTMKSESLPRTGCHNASTSHQVMTNTTATTPPVMWTENTPSNASTASGMRSRWRTADITSAIVGTATP